MFGVDESERIVAAFEKLSAEIGAQPPAPGATRIVWFMARRLLLNLQVGRRGVCERPLKSRMRDVDTFFSA